MSKRGTRIRRAEITEACDARQRHGKLTINTPVGPIEIIDPHGSNPGDTIITFRSLRSDPIAEIHARGGITDIQYDAGRGYQRLYERSQIGSVQAMDLTKPYIDGGGIGESNTDDQLRVYEILKGVNSALGKRAAALLHDVLVLELIVRDAAAKRGLFSDRQINYLGKCLADALDDVAIELGLMSAPQIPAIPRPPGARRDKPRNKAVPRGRIHPFNSI